MNSKLIQAGQFNTKTHKKIHISMQRTMVGSLRPHSSRLRFCCAMILFKDLKFFISIFQSGKYSLISYWSGTSYKVNFWNTFCSLHDLRSYRKQRITQKWGLHEAPPKRQFTKYYGIFRFGESSVVGVMILLVLTTTLGLTENYNGISIQRSPRYNERFSIPQ